MGVQMEDNRFKVAKKEALIGIALVIINFIWWFGFAYGFGSGDPAEYKYIFGLPEWFFYSCVLGFIVMSLVVTFSVKFFFTDVPFEGDDEGEDIL